MRGSSKAATKNDTPKLQELKRGSLPVVKRDEISQTTLFLKKKEIEARINELTSGQKGVSSPGLSA